MSNGSSIWVSNPCTGQAMSLTSAWIGDSPPSPAQPGALWWDSDSTSSGGGQLYIFYNDGNSSQWVAATNEIADLNAETPISFSFSGPVAASAFVIVPVTFPITFPQNFAGSLGYANVKPTAAFNFGIYTMPISGTAWTQIGFATFAASTANAVFSGPAGLVPAGDLVMIQAAATADTTLANVSFTLLAMRA